MSIEIEEPSRHSGMDGGGFTLLDGIALVIGAAIASAHLRRSVPFDELSGAGWVLLWLTFSGIALTATGPFLTLIRWLSGRPGTPARLGDRLWVLLGTPWVVATIPRIMADSGPEGRDVAVQLYDFTLVTGIGISTIVTLAIIWSRWVMVPADTAGEEDPAGWTHRVGLILGIAWPLQCGLGMVVIGPHV